MMKILIKQTLFTSLLLSSLQAFAKGPHIDPNKMNALNGDTSQSGQHFSAPITNTTQGARDGSSGTDLSQIVTNGVFVYTTAVCFGSEFTDQYACLLAIASSKQISASSKAAGDANAFGNQYKPFDPFAANNQNGGAPAYDPNNLTDPNNPNNPNYIKPNSTSAAGDNSKTDPNSPYNGLSALQKSQLQKLRSDLSQAGVSIDDKAGTIKFADGKTLSLKSTPADLKAAGYDGAQIDKTFSDVQAYAANLAAKAGAGNGGGVPALTFGNPGGGGGSRGAGSGSASNNNSNIDLNALMNGGRKPSAIDKQGVAGLSRKLGDESIGVKGDNIFEMVNRRYRAQDKQNAFLRDK